MLKKYAKSLMERQLNQPIQMDATTSPAVTTYQPEAPRTMYQEEIPPDMESLSSLSKTVETKVTSYDDPETVIGEKVAIKGTLSFERHLRIDGSFEGELLSDGKLVVGPKGYVKADLNLLEAFISGKVEGDISVKKRLVLRGRAEIHGNIKASTLSVDEGVTIIGKVEVIPTASEEEDF